MVATRSISSPFDSTAVIPKNTPQAQNWPSSGRGHVHPAGFGWRAPVGLGAGWRDRLMLVDLESEAWQQSGTAPSCTAGGGAAQDPLRPVEAEPDGGHEISIPFESLLALVDSTGRWGDLVRRR
jgi:hypothetical protein